jgi:site-specific DNA recombinase
MEEQELQKIFNEGKKPNQKKKKNQNEYVAPLNSVAINADSRPGFLYMRVSTNMQYETGFSLEQQESALIDHCNKNNIYIVDKFIEAVSGGSMERNELKRMLKSLKPGYCVLATSVSRLSRNIDDLIEINKIINKSKASLILLDIFMDTSTANGKLLLMMLGTVSEIEREQISTRVSNVMQHLKKKGQLKCKPHYGWTRNESGELIKKPDEQAVIDMIRIIVKNDPDITVNKIIKKLHEKDFTNRKQKKFHVSTIESIMLYNNIPYKHFKETKTIDTDTEAQLIINKEEKEQKEQEQTNTISNSFYNQHIMPNNIQNQLHQQNFTIQNQVQQNQLYHQNNIYYQNLHNQMYYQNQLQNQMYNQNQQYYNQNIPQIYQNQINMPNNIEDMLITDDDLKNL